MSRIRRLFADLRRPERRGDALRRVWRRATRPFRSGGGSEVRAPVSAPTLDAARAAARQRAEATLAQSIARGEPLERAVTATVSDLIDLAEWHMAWSVAEGAGRLPDGTTASAMGHAVLHHRRRHLDRAWTVVRALDDVALATFIPIEAVDAALAARSDEGRRKALAIAASSAVMDAEVVVGVAGRLLAFGERVGAGELVAGLRRRPSLDLGDVGHGALSRIEGWLRPSSPTIPAGSTPVAVLGYRTPEPDEAAGDVGDAIQTLAVVGNLARMRHVSFTGADGLGELATELQDRVAPGHQLADATGSVHLVTIDRDFSSAAHVPDGTWLIACGWHQRALFDVRVDFPFHPNVRPIFLSFHVGRLDLLSDEAKAYLRRYGPVGCRDWDTVFLLLGAGVDAFFSGCLTTTLDVLYPARVTTDRDTGVVGVLDLPREAAGRHARTVRAIDATLDGAAAAPAADARAADVMLAAAREDLDRVVTGRLRPYLALTTLGVPVEFRARWKGDERLAGLTGLQPGDPSLTEMRDGIREVLGPLLNDIASGAPEADVYARWRDVTESRVAEARARFQAPVAEATTTADIAAIVAIIRGGAQRFGPHDAVDRDAVTEIVLAFDQNLTTPAAVLVQSIVANASGPLRLWVLARGLPAVYPGWLAAAFPTIPMTFLPCDQVTYGPKGRPRRMTSRITISTMDRLLLPALLDHVDRAVYLDVDTLVLDDICRLGRIDLAGRPLAARDSNVSEVHEWVRAGRGLEGSLAVELRRRMARDHGVEHPALNAGVLVLDLERMRLDDFIATSLGLVERYGFHDQDTLLAYVGPERVVIEPRWNAMPVLEDVPHPSLIHWASFGKPWEPTLTYEQERWRAYAEQLRARAGDAPAGGAATIL